MADPWYGGTSVLTDAKIKAARPREAAYKLGDSGQLFLHVTPAGGKHWRMNYTYGRNEAGRPAQKTLKLGPYPALTLLDARKRRDEAKYQLRDGRDPAVERRVSTKARTAETENTFEIVARRWHDLRLPTWSAIHGMDVMRSLERDVFPAIGDLPITVIDSAKVLETLSAIAARGAVETAHRIRQRISDVYVYAIPAGLAKSNPAADLVKALPKVPRSKKQASIIDRLEDHGDQLRAVRQMVIDCEAERCRAATKLALRLLALTAVRPNEIRGARWDELEDVEARFGHVKGERVQINQPAWRIPAARMKGDQERKAEEGGDHIVPLSTHALAVINALRPLTGGYQLMFPSERHVHHPISENTLRALLIRAGYYQRHVPHGFRAAFSTIMNGLFPADRAIIDLMLAHVPKDKVESAYNRAAHMARRRELAQDWGDRLVGDMWTPDAYVGQPIRWAATGRGRL
ncbi:tyrosine-type recombinase/integrase [Sphingomonas nostoxanthinifaciens]|uniref:tyrosine-type recombinase/integrase n=1 Tax=Sphingomonas nostoxanthinifaciens TaxID=2872652 RepID=UPI001CC1D51B|nr:integrase arm-type DNA-binding domain-containing protein [Sphingomonas nostoxanthinifaciens]UAK25839.1 integrase arm-type DNA-binding domain-containing protein [Sphingomonas nostoxanthinifaciens]